MDLDYIAYQGFIDERMRRQIALLQANGWQVRAILNYPRNYRAQIEGEETRVIIPSRIVSNPLLDLLFFVPLFILLRYFPLFVHSRNRLRLLYVLNFPDSYAVPYLLLAKLFRVPTIYEIRDPWKEYFLTESHIGAINRTRLRLTFSFMALVEKIGILLATGVVFVNQSYREVHASDSRGKRTCMINNYSNYSYNEYVITQAFALRRKLGIEDKVVASFISGGFQRYRGIELLLESMIQVITGNPKLTLLIVGGTAESCALIQKEIQALGLEKNCIVTGWIPGAELIFYFLVSDFGILPWGRSAAAELTAAIKLFDYMALGKPVILASLREQSRYVIDGVNGLKVKPDDPNDLARAILELANNPIRLKQMSKRAMEEGKKYRFADLEPVFLDFVSRISKKTES